MVPSLILVLLVPPSLLHIDRRPMAQSMTAMQQDTKIRLLFSSIAAIGTLIMME
jgi:hypothetical protein